MRKRVGIDGEKLIVCRIVRGYSLEKWSDPLDELATAANLSHGRTITVTLVTIGVTTLHPPRNTAMKLVRFVSHNDVRNSNARLKVGPDF